jgi:3-oxoacyl-[acyl-carrier protein] reductase
MSSLQGTTAVVTGGSQGIGAGIVRKLAEQGAAVLFNYNSNKEPAEKLVEELEANGSRAITVKADVTDGDELDAMFETAARHFGKIDTLVNNAGIFKFSPIEDLTHEHLLELYGTNVFAPIFAIKAALKIFNDGGSIINIGSIAATLAPPNAIGYSSSKNALHGVTKVLSKELAPRSITVNQINPGSIRTEGTKEAGVDEEVEKGLIETIPLGRIGFPEDVAGLVAFLASSEAKWITGEIIKVSGGAR